ncbi:hypothetical protein MKX01_002161 [Papaver californicum]|nr:hypothetical protein MKX01_002161 [Papaver californicum]
MASLKQFSLIALILGFILVSSFANAARTTDEVIPEGGGSCDILVDTHIECTHSEECTDQCERQGYHKGGFCLSMDYDLDGTHICCCYW